MKYIVEAIEEGIAILVNDKKQKLQVKLSELPDEVKEGVVLILDCDRFIISEDETIRRRKLMFEKQKRLFGKK